MVLTLAVNDGRLARNPAAGINLPRFLIDELATHVPTKQPDELVFTGVKGGPLRSKAFQDATLTAAAKYIGVAGLTPHKLRHTAASLAIGSGANVKVVQQMLGHKSATMTLDLYGHLFGDHLDEVADAVDTAQRSHGRRCCPPVAQAANLTVSGWFQTTARPRLTCG